MAAECKVCASSHRDAVDSAIISGATAVSIAASTGLHESSIRRHGRHHTGKRLGILSIADGVTADDLVARLSSSLAAVGVALAQASERSNSAATIAASREQRAIIAQLADLFGIDQQSTADRQAAQGDFFKALALVGQREPSVVLNLADALDRRTLPDLADAVRSFAPAPTLVLA